MNLPSNATNPVLVTTSTTGTAGSTTPSTTLPPNVTADAVYLAAAPTLTNGQASPLLSDVNGNLKSVEQKAAVAEDNTIGVFKVEQRFSFTNQAGTTAGVLVKSGAGFLHALVINTPAANAVITLYDNTAASGTKIATITFPAALVSDGPITVLYDVAFSTGLELVVATGACDVTVSWR